MNEDQRNFLAKNTHLRIVNIEINSLKHDGIVVVDIEESDEYGRPNLYIPTDSCHVQNFYAFVFSNMVEGKNE